ncbi:sugar/nucleoside kinase (ribokinase family) [Spinactinospora alkalitolerans]|uniref:Sugar/nucleoside kinase (Ribokinase family) n=1 Tax=Spinactinospora alkalitolerans TaxID=687207 RepID=A0A852TR74_9ACTN|nr:carbohydrate kinase family protein [Spinactinospora alkalitolerans]NYE46061.1 sugar/nucleoside kinase (ribokinase family) [Spinactinospora alkalitolerans]
MILFCGYANVDVVARVPGLPGGGDRVHAAAIEYRHGGMGANAAVAAARMGADAAFGGAVGTAPMDREFLAALAADGVDTDWCHTDASVATAIVLVTPDGERAIISRDDGLDPARIAAGVRRLAARGGGWLYLDGYRWPHAADALAEADPAGTVRLFVDLDGCADPDAARVALSCARHAVAGRAQLESLFGATGETLSALARRHDVVLLATDGANGWRLAEPGGRVEHGAALPVDAVDATGAGDCFSGAYLAGLDEGLAPVAAAGTAAAAAALSCTVTGARGAPDRGAVEALSAGAADRPTRTTPIRSTP